MKTIKALFPVYWQLISSREGIILITGILAVVFYDTFYLQVVRLFPAYSMQLFLLTGILWLFIFPSLVNRIFMKIPYRELGGSVGSVRSWGNGYFFACFGHWVGIYSFKESILSFFFYVSSRTYFISAICILPMHGCSVYVFLGIFL